jgi:hypothetical protein
MKSSSRWESKFLLVIFTLFLSVSMMSCVTSRKNLDVSANFIKTRYETIGLLVVRVGCQVSWGVSTALPTIKTDFSNRVSKSTGVFNTSSEPPIPVYIEDEKRLKESFPYYPRTTEAPVTYTGLGGFLVNGVIEFYKNLSPQLYETTYNVLKRKGYSVVDIQTVSKSWVKPVSESTVEEIIDQSLSLVDGLLLIQYMDVGNTNQTIAFTISSVQTGLSDIEYNVSLFDSKTKERVISFEKEGLLFLLNVIKSDPDIINDPEKNSKITTSATGSGASSTSKNDTSITTSYFTEDEMVGFLMKYIEKGRVFDSGYKWTGLDEIIP